LLFDDMARTAHFGENMRNVHVKSRSLVIIGTFLLGFAAFSFWGLSTENNDLLAKIELLEDNLKIGTHKQKELEDELQSMMRKSADCSKSSSKLTSDLHQKENVVNAQAEEASQWRDKVRRAESEIEKLKASFSDKLDEVSKLKAQIETKKNEISAKDAQIHEAQENLSKMKIQLDAKSSPSSQDSPSKMVINQTSSTSTSQPKDSNIVLAKPLPETDVQNNLPERYVNEPVMSKPDENDGGEEVELVDPDANKSNNAPANRVDINFEKKFKDLEEALGVMGDKNDNVETNDVGNIMEPNLINSLGDDEEVAAPMDKNQRPFHPRSMAKDMDPNPEDPDTELDDDRMDK